MVKRILLFIRAGVLLSIISLTGCSTAINRIKSGGVSNLNSNYLCPTHAFYNDKTLNSGRLHYLSEAGPDALAAIDTAKACIIKHAGEEFLGRVNLYSISVTYKDSVDAYKKRYINTPFSSEKCGEVKYCIEFSFTPYKEAIYFFDIVLNDNYQLVSDLSLPSKQDNGSYNVISPQRAAGIALRKYRRFLKNAESISLEYDDELECFVWEVHGGDRKYVNHGKYEFWSVRVDAVTGRPVSTKLKNGYYHATYF